MKPTLVVLAAGMGSRYGGLKQVDPVGPSGEAILDYSVFDAHRAGFGKVVFIIRKDIEEVFRRQVGAKYEGLLPVDYAFQDIHDIPAPYAVPAGRTKPWGTAHAIRAARHVVHEPFAAINADDFYGRDAFARLAAFLGGVDASARPLRFAMVGYKLDLTLSDHGSVARGICQVTPEGRLAGVTEMTKLVRTPEGAENREDPASPVKLTGTERVSMNLWGFTPALFGALEERFPAWLDQNLPVNPLKCEYFLPLVANALIQEHEGSIRVLNCHETWHGITYREDMESVVSYIAGLREKGVYPETLLD